MLRPILRLLALPLLAAPFAPDALVPAAAAQTSFADGGPSRQEGPTPAKPPEGGAPAAKPEEK